MQSLTLGPDSASLTIRTDVAGRASRFGHRLLLTLENWSATVEFDGGTPTKVDVAVQVADFKIGKAQGGVTPLSDIDRSVITRTAKKLLDVAGHPEATFKSGSVTQTPSGYALTGPLIIKGKEQTVEINVKVTKQDSAWDLSAQVSVRQTDFDVKPYSAMLGTLRVRDEVKVELTAQVPFN